MASIPVKAAKRIRAGLRQFQPIVSSARSRDVNESDTVTLVTDILQEVFGYDKYTEITSEHAIRGTYCDLAVRVDGSIRFIMEVKAIGIDFRDGHVKQAVDYAANLGVEWVVLTNAVIWRAYRVSFNKPIDHEMVMEIDLLALDPRSDEHIGALLHLSREGLAKDLLDNYHARRQAMSRYVLGAMLTEDAVLKVLRRELKRLTPDVKIDVDEIRSTLIQEVLKREVVDSEEIEAARKQLDRANRAASCKRPQSRSASAATPDVTEDCPGDT